MISMWALASGPEFAHDALSQCPARWLAGAAAVPRGVVGAGVGCQALFRVDGARLRPLHKDGTFRYTAVRDCPHQVFETFGLIQILLIVARKEWYQTIKATLITEHIIILVHHPSYEGLSLVLTASFCRRIEALLCEWLSRSNCGHRISFIRCSDEHWTCCTCRSCLCRNLPLVEWCDVGRSVIGQNRADCRSGSCGCWNCCSGRKVRCRTLTLTEGC